MCLSCHHRLPKIFIGILALASLYAITSVSFLAEFDSLVHLYISSPRRNTPIVPNSAQLQALRDYMNYITPSLNRLRAEHVNHKCPENDPASHGAATFVGCCTVCNYLSWRDFRLFVQTQRGLTYRCNFNTGESSIGVNCLL